MNDVVEPWHWLQSPLVGCGARRPGHDADAEPAHAGLVTRRRRACLPQPRDSSAVPAKVVKFVVEWHASQPAVPYRNVRRRHSGSLHPVVAAGAAARDAVVFEYCARPAYRRMAGVALEVRLDVRRALALRLHVVVTGRAAPERLGVIEVDRWLPRNRGVTAIATVGRENVIGVLGGRADRRSNTVAGAALARGALEHRVGMTRLAGQVAMLTQQLETRREVIERVPRLGGKGRRDRQQGRVPTMW